MNYLQSWLKKWAPLVERFLCGAVIFATVVVIVSQLMLTNTEIRFRLSRVDYLTGVPYNWLEEIGVSGAVPDSAMNGVYWIELKLRRGEGPLELLRNGSAAGVLDSENIIVYVNPGDIIELRGETDRGQPAVVEVVSTRGLIYPRVGFQVTTYGDYELIGWAVPGDGEQ